MKVLVSASTGKVGSKVLHHLKSMPDVQVFATSRREKELSDEVLFFDLSEPKRSAASLQGMDSVFLLLPPGFSSPGPAFTTLLNSIEGEKPHAVVMTVQGANLHTFLPHHSVEEAVMASTPKHTFLRPSYFMQNLNDIFGREIRENGKLVAPLGTAKLMWVDTDDIALTAATILASPAEHEGKGYDITGSDLCGFGPVAEMLSEAMGKPVVYESPFPLNYFVREWWNGAGLGFSFIKTMIHFCERFKDVPPTSPAVEDITSRPPTLLRDYITEAFGPSAATDAAPVQQAAAPDVSTSADD